MVRCQTCISAETERLRPVSYRGNARTVHHFQSSPNLHVAFQIQLSRRRWGLSTDAPKTGRQLGWTGWQSTTGRHFKSASAASTLCTFTFAAMLARQNACRFIQRRFPFDSAVTVPASPNVQQFEVVSVCLNASTRTRIRQAMWGRLGLFPKRRPPRLTPHRASQYCDILWRVDFGISCAVRYWN